MKHKYRLQITLPESLLNIPIEVRCDKNSDIVVLNVLSEDDEMTSEKDQIYCDQCMIWCKGEFGHFALDDIVRIEANGSYSNIFLQDKRAILVSYPLNILQQDLPKCQFIRILEYLMELLNFPTFCVGKVRYSNAINVMLADVAFNFKRAMAFLWAYIMVYLRKNIRPQGDTEIGYCYF